MVWYAPPEEGWAPEEVAQEAPMPGHLIQGGDTRRVIPRGIPDRGIPPNPCHGDTSPECIGGDRRAGIGVRRGWNRGIGCVNICWYEGDNIPTSSAVALLSGTVY